MSSMDPELHEAARKGDINFLIGALSQHSPDYFLTQQGSDRNIFHIAAWNERVEFIKEAIQRLPKHILNQLLFQKNENGRTPLHIAAELRSAVQIETNREIINLILDYYNSMPNDEAGKPSKPWLALTTNNKTPLHVHLQNPMVDEQIAMELLSLDVELLSNMVGDNGISTLFLAVRNRYSQVAEKILSECPLSSISFSGKNGLTPLHMAPNCSENVFKLLLKNFGECIDKIDDRGYSVLHQWAKIGEAWPCELLLESTEFAEARTKVFKVLVFLNDNDAGDTPLHISAKNKESELGETLIRGYQQVSRLNEAEIQESVPPWKIQNNVGDIPLITAMYPDGRHELAVKILSIDPTTCQILNNRSESIFFIAVMVKCESAVKEILRIEEPRYNMLRRNDGTTVLHYLHGLSEITGRRLLEKYWWMINLADDKNITPLDKAIENNAPWLVNLLRNPSLIEREPFDWITACKREETPAILAFIDTCYDFQRVCRKQNDTPLHHIKLPTDKAYQDFLKIPSIAELKNTTDHDGSTPLHRALERKNMLLSKALLLDNGVERTISNNNGTTAMDLLDHICNENDDWEKMCKQIKVNPYLKTTYIQPGTNLEQIRNTLSVVAALLATITFAAGFTLPGGINSDTGEALLAKKASFLVFLLADVYAMCTSMLVLFCLIWSMVSEPDMARVLVDRSVYILMQSLYATLLTFMMGIYTVISNKSLWAAILIFVMCSLVGISANRTFLHKVIAWLIPATNTRKKYPLHLLEEGGIAKTQ